MKRTVLLALAATFAMAAISCGSTDDDDQGTDPAVDRGPIPDEGPPPDDGPAVDNGPPCDGPTIPALATVEVAPDAEFDRPLFVTQAPGNSDTLWVVQREGTIVLVRDDAIVGTFLDIGDVVASSSARNDERGLLGLAFHPDYATNGRFFVYYTSTDRPMRNVVGEYRVSANPDVADPTEVARLVAIVDREGNHNGGMLAFSPLDGFLYVGTGDEGGGCDQHGDPGNGQSLETLHGKILRLDVDNDEGDYVAAGNPFAAGGGQPQIYHYGLRNPWRFSFDRVTGDLYVADVGQNAIEEVTVAAPSDGGGLNLGWRFFEANRRSSVSSCDDEGWDQIDHFEPQIVIGQRDFGEVLTGACSITGGYAYRGSAIPELQGTYLVGDWCSPDIGAFNYCEGAAVGFTPVNDLRSVGDGLASFGQDNAGELYLVFLGDSSIHRIIPAD